MQQCIYFLELTTYQIYYCIHITCNYASNDWKKMNAINYGPYINKEYLLLDDLFLLFMDLI